MIRVLVNPDVPAFDHWWEAADAAGGSAPDPMLRLLMGADVIDVTEHEAADIEAWASTIKGWNPDAPDNEKPLLFQAADKAQPL
jgi:hypothetical protein